MGDLPVVEVAEVLANAALQVQDLVDAEKPLPFNHVELALSKNLVKSARLIRFVKPLMHLAGKDGVQKPIAFQDKLIVLAAIVACVVFIAPQGDWPAPLADSISGGFPWNC
jgi:hypothetical protein